MFPKRNAERQNDGGFTQELRWIAHDGALALREQRSIGWTAIDEQSWRLIFDSELRTDAGAQLGSPGSKGRIGDQRGGQGNNQRESARTTATPKK